jgi:hypothetical protein
VHYLLRAGFPTVALMLLLFGAEAPTEVTTGEIIFFSAILNGYSIGGIAMFVYYSRRLNGYKFFAYFFDLGLHTVVLIWIYAVIYSRLGLLEADKSVEKAIDFLYFSIVTWTTVGYGDIRPSPVTRMFAASEGLFGYVFMGLYLALIFYVIQSRSNPKGGVDGDG